MAQDSDPIPQGDRRDRDVITDRPIVATTSDLDPHPTYVSTAAPVVTEAPVVVDRPSRFPAFIAGFITALILGAIAFGTFLVVSDADDDGNIDVDVPAVDVSTG